jgi:actin beta/gamma 1
MYADDEEIGLVVDNGCYQIKAGFASDDAPRCVIANAIGAAESGESFVGDNAQCKRDIVDISCPISRGVIGDWDSMEMIWDYVFTSELRTSPVNKPIFMSESPLSCKSQRERISTVIFEKFQASSFYIAPEPVFPMYASGSVSGVVYTSGEDITSVFPIFEGYFLPEKISRIDFGGSDITKLVSASLFEKGYANLSSGIKDITTVRAIKERLCYAASEFATENTKLAERNAAEKEVSYTLPDGQIITLGDARYTTVEPMFQPSLFGMKCKGVSELIRNVLMDSDLDLRKSLAANVLLSGGNTRIAGFPERVRLDLEKCLPKSLKFNVRVPPEQHSVWIGMSIVASLTNHKALWISKDEYNEYGPSVVHRNSV